MPEIAFEYFCHVCGHREDLRYEVPAAPDMKEYSIDCHSCGDSTNILITACPDCKESVRYFVSDLDFPKEIYSISLAYVELIAGIRSSLGEIIEQFEVPLPEQWSVELNCECGAEYVASIPLARFEDI
ncbi:hypothetical protein EU537_09555 [Candidatus Thorarchaeota archaeon]|nr:MAG: hypothetical protein EU537_09555 [Candidatus Thorarchaeota archaeon]